MDRGYAVGTGASGGRAATSDAGGGATGGQGGGNACQPGQPILVGAVVNARDVGGISVGDGAIVACGAVYRGPPLANLTAQGCAAFAALEIRTVVDLRMPEERAAKAESACVQSAANIVLAPLPIPYNVSPTDYIADLNTTASIAQVFRALGNDAAYPIYIHCTWGRDRTGVVGAVVLLALGASRDAIMAEYLLSQSSVGAYPNSLAAVLDEVARRGGVEAYLTAAGISADELAVFRARAVAR